MNIIVAQNAGFCFGVTRAVNAVYKNLDKPGDLYTLGSIIHNSQVIQELKDKGVIIKEGIENINDGTVIIRSHGVSEDIYNSLNKKGLTIVDATCPYVKRIHNLVRRNYNSGYNIIIVGEKEHPEVKGINGWCNNEAYIIYNEKDVDSIPHLNKACVVAQTTISLNKWVTLLKALQNKALHMRVFNTICQTTLDRQKEAEKIAKIADVMIVIGGENSSNTRKLYNLCKEYCEKTITIETADDVDLETINSISTVGITAGASTPDWIIKEVIKKMNIIEENNKHLHENEQNDSVDNNQATNEKDTKKDPSTPDISETDSRLDEIETMEDFEKTMITLRQGQIVKGEIMQVSTDGIIVNIGYKSDGIVPIDQIVLDSKEDIFDKYKSGDQIEVEVIKTNDGEGNVLLSRKTIEEKSIWAFIEEGRKSGAEFEGICVEVVKGGVLAKIKGINTFVPASQLSTSFIEDLGSFVGTKLRLRILELDKRRNRIVASQKVVIQEEEKAKREELWSLLKEGEKITGEVKRLTNFGAFVDIGGIDGLIHVSDLSWGRVKHPRDVVEEGQHVEVIVLSLDKEKGRISLGYKQTIPHPWDNAENKYPVGSVVSGKVVRITSFGAFVELEPGIDGLVHISQVANKRIDKVEDVLKIGDQVDVRVLDIKPDEHRVSLSIKDALKQEESEIKRTKDLEGEPTEYKKEDMTVTLGEFFPDELTK